MKWNGEVDVASIDPEFLRDGFSSFLASARRLETDGAVIVHPVTGQPDEHLRVHSGVHLRPGVVYESLSNRLSPRAAAASLPYITVDGRSVPIDDPAAQAHLKSLSAIGTTARALISLEANNEQLLRLSGVDDETAWHVDVERPRKASKVTGGGQLDTGSDSWFGGIATFAAAADLDRWCALDHRARDVAEVTVEHRRFRVDLDVTARLSDDRIVVQLSGRGRGCGVARPVAALVSLVFGRRIKKFLDRELAGFDGDLDELRAEIDTYESPDEMGDAMLRAMFSDAPEPRDPE